MLQELCSATLGGDCACLQVQPCHALLSHLCADSRHSAFWNAAHPCSAGAPACAADRYAAYIVWSHYGITLMVDTLMLSCLYCSLGCHHAGQ